MGKDSREAGLGRKTRCVVLDKSMRCLSGDVSRYWIQVSGVHGKKCG